MDTKDQVVFDLQLTSTLPLPLAPWKVRWQIQLNVKNVHPTTFAPLTYRYQDPRQFVLTNTFDF